MSLTALAATAWIPIVLAAALAQTARNAAQRGIRQWFFTLEDRRAW